MKQFGWMGTLLGMLIGVVTAAGAARAAEAPSPDSIEFFESRIRPVLVEHCYSCHNSTQTAEGELALDQRDRLRMGGSRGPAIVVGKPDESLLLKVVRHEIDDLKMPAEGAKLDAAVVADIARWIERGAADPRDVAPTADQLAESISWSATFERRRQWWCFQPIARPPIPGAGAKWSDHPVDRFIAQQLEAKGLVPSPSAERAVLARRLSFVLTGLPPTPAEAEAFLNDGSPEAYERLVEKNLASPRFGEHWARHWMDWIRFAESHGSEGDPAIPHAHRYRDYLIRALNDDVPFDQLAREHVAGDLLNPPRLSADGKVKESALGVAHWRMVFHGFAPTDALAEKVRFTDDQINTFSKAFLGLTVSCARCHDHKFDAISQKDYYALFGILGSTRPAILDANVVDRPEAKAAELRELKQRIKAGLIPRWIESTRQLASDLEKPTDALRKVIGESNSGDRLLQFWRQVEQESPSADGFGDAVARQVKAWESASRPRDAGAPTHRWRFWDASDARSWFRMGPAVEGDPFPAGTFAIAPTGEAILTGVYPAGLYTHDLSDRQRGVLGSPHFRVNGPNELWMHVAGDGGAFARYAVQNYPRDGTVYPVSSLNGGRWKWVRFDLSYWSGDDLHVELTTAADSPVLSTGTERSWFGVREVVVAPKGSPPFDERAPELWAPLVKGAREQPVRTRAALAALTARTLEEAIRAWSDGQATDIQALWIDSALRDGLLPNQPDALPEVAKLRDDYRRVESELPTPTRVAGLAEADSADQELFVRGDHTRLADCVPRRFLEVFDPVTYQTSQSGRLELARDLVHPENPLVARVIVNRIWHHLFDRGIVSTPDNFGRMGENPTHPALLDYLATRLIEHHWSLKETIRFLLLSKTWKQSSVPSEKSREVDPDNRYWSHARVRRLEAESIRDAMLSVSGALDPVLFGPSVEGSSARRSVYVRVQRNRLDPFLRVFDFPEPFTATGRRDSTNVPAQSLTLMNDPRIEELAKTWAGRVLDNAALKTDADRITHMFAEAFTRPATPAEAAKVSAFLANNQVERQRLVAQADGLRTRIRDGRAAVDRILGPARETLVDRERGSVTAAPIEPPIARWEFDEDLHDSLGSMSSTAFGGARIEDGSLRLDGRQAHVVTAPFDRSLKAKTLEAWVQLDNLEQRGGGVMTVQSPDGVVFDSIVFGEKDPRQWLAGSDFHHRTQSFGGPVETDALSRVVHVAIAFHADGRVVGYRDGKPYGDGYPSNGPHEFAPREWNVAFGVRHLPAEGNRMLAGRILRAQLHDRALSAEEVSRSAAGGPATVSDAQVIAALSSSDREELNRLRTENADLEARLRELGKVPSAVDPVDSWADLARSLFGFKEFIYIP